MQKFKYLKKLLTRHAAIACLIPATAYSNADDTSPPANVAYSEQTTLAGYKVLQTNRISALLAPSLQFKNVAGTPAHFQEVFDYHCQIARKGDANGYYVMGMLHLYGDGIKKNLSLASTLLSKAAELDHEKAKGILEVMPRPAEQATLPACLTNVPAGQTSVIGEFYKRDGKIHRLVSRLAPKYGIDIDLVMAVIAVESGFNPLATSPKNAQGLMQLIPDTASRYQVENPYDPEQNVKGGLAYLRWLVDQFEGNVALVAAAYNAGEKTIERYGGIPPYPETQDYVQKIRSLYPKSSHPYRDRMGKMIDPSATQ